ncbi:MAG: SpoIIE family protein phosphatase [Verrucomicrobia bacterium]|nr:SpoIIE family protein phosphatase [Verrucomicrobiota bacterium]
MPNPFEDNAKTRDQLLDELNALRQQVSGSDIPALKRSLAVERVRAVVMAMRTSDDLLNVIGTMHQELRALGILSMVTAIYLLDSQTKRQINYRAIENPRKYGISWKPTITEFNEDIVVRKGVTEVYEQFWKNKEPSVFPYPINVERLTQNLKIWGFVGDIDSWGRSFEGVSFMVRIPFQQGVITIDLPNENPDCITIGLELSHALSLGFTRFLDLQKAEEAQSQLINELQKQLQTAHDLQMAQMPTDAPQIEGFELAGRCITANHVGGDFFQYFEQGGKLSVAIADVTGHAMDAAIPVVMFSGVLDSQMQLGANLADLFLRLNHSMYRNLDTRTFVCFTMGELDL